MSFGKDQPFRQQAFRRIDGDNARHFVDMDEYFFAPRYEIRRATVGRSQVQHQPLRQLVGISHESQWPSIDMYHLHADEIMQITDGRGVDAVLNSLAGDFIPRSLAVLAPFGRFLEIGKHDIYGDATLALGAFRKNLTFQSIDLDLMARQQPELVQALFAELMTAVVRGELTPHAPRRYAHRHRPHAAAAIGLPGTFHYVAAHDRARNDISCS